MKVRFASRFTFTAVALLQVAAYVYALSHH